ncbi:MAG: undecaprenyldiphospho-muramoylpentapeptide beta-N-acetylglucosaminyltransferase [Candidatus Malihini olakiniferum]
MSTKGKRLIVMAGGTGGHVFPGLAVAHHLMAEGWQVHWLGTADRMEADLVPKNGIYVDFICTSSLCGKGASAQLHALFRVYRAVRQAKTIMKRYQPDVVLGMGGYVSGPGGLAAWLCGIPLVLHEQNSIAGLTNRWLSPIASKVLQAFPGALPNADVVGNPVRRDLLALPAPDERLSGREGPIRVLVMGGSQGAQVLNRTMPKVAAQLGANFSIWHQTGKNALSEVKHAYESAGSPQHKFTEFIDDMAKAYGWADVVVCRSGALTVSEIATAGLPALFVPFDHKDRQQYWNALPLEKASAAKIIEQATLNVNVVSDVLSGWDRAILRDMAQRASFTARPDATDRVAEEVIAAAR